MSARGSGGHATRSLGLKPAARRRTDPGHPYPASGSMNVDSEPIELADEIEDRLDEAAEAIPRSILLLRKIA